MDARGRSGGPGRAATPAPAASWQSRLEAAWLERGGLGRWLAPLGAVVGALAAARRALWQRGWRQPVPVGLPVVVVGNLVAGGAGKTPVVLALVEALRAVGHRPGIVSRGYGGSRPRAADGSDRMEVTARSSARETGDEPLLLHRRSGCPVMVGSDRVAVARALHAAHPGLTVLVCDDGLQHRRLARQVEVIVFDERGAGNGRCLPAGPLREPMGVRPPAGAVVVYNADRPSTPWPGERLQRGLGGVVSLEDWWQGHPASPDALEALREADDLVAVAGTARPGRFFAQLEAVGLRFTALPLPDHHPYATLPWPAGTAQVILTEKDAVKLDPAAPGGTRVWVAPLDCRLDVRSVAAVLERLPPLAAAAALHPAR